MPEISLYFLNDIAYSDTIYDPLFTFVGNASLLKYTIYCDVDCDFGFRWCVDSQFQVISTDTYSLTVGTEQSIIVPITSHYVQIFVNNIASNPCDLKTQVFFLNNFSSLAGTTGPEGIQGATGPQGIQGATGPQGDGADVILTSAGGVSLVSDGIGPELDIKGLIEGTGISFISTGTDITINSTTSSPYQQIGNDISPITSSVSAIVSGESNSTTNSINSLIGGSTNCNASGYRTKNSAIIGSVDSAITTSGSNGSGKQCVIIGSDTGSITSWAGVGVGIYSSITSSIPSEGLYSVIVGSIDSVITNGCKYSGIYSSDGSNITNDRIKTSIITASTDCSISSGGASSTQGNMIITGSNTCTIGGSDSGTIGGIYSSLNSSIDGINNTNSIISGSNSSISGNNRNNCVLMGANATILHAGNFLFSDSAGGTSLTSNASHGFSVRCSGGARLFSNTTNTAGVSLASGSGSWASVSDRNVKENLEEFDNIKCHEISNKFKQIPIYNYNFIGNPKEQVCYGVMAQDWHSQFGCDEITIEKQKISVDIDGKESLIIEKDEEGNIMYEKKPAKDPLKIETMDMIGVLMATVKDLQNEQTNLYNTIELLTGEIEALKILKLNL